MRKIALLVLMVITLNVFAQKTDTFSVVSYNIHHGNPPSKPVVIDLDSIAGVLAKADADFIALQEVDVNVPRSGNVNQAEYLANKLGMQYFFAKAIDLKGGEYGVAVLSKYSILDKQSILYKRIEARSGEDRVLAIITAKLKTGRKVKIASTHLDHVRDETLRVSQVTELIDYVKVEKLPFIIGGDFNANPSSSTIQLLDQHLIRTCGDCGFTIPVVKPNRAIDFIAFNKNRDISVLSHEVIQEHYASDHLPIKAIIKIE
jgi:endonuclease/exonuclease/phosphatase family metal-dependent hydrolase